MRNMNIEQFINEHASILISLKKVIVFGLDSKEGQHILFSMKNEIIDHLKNENDKILPLIKQASKNDIEFKNKIEEISSNLNSSTEFVLNFYEKYSEGASGINFIYDFRSFFSVLSQRIRNEEKVIYRKLLEDTIQ